MVLWLNPSSMSCRRVMRPCCFAAIPAAARCLSRSGHIWPWFDKERCCGVVEATGSGVESSAVVHVLEGDTEVLLFQRLHDVLQRVDRLRRDADLLSLDRRLGLHLLVLDVLHYLLG